MPHHRPLLAMTSHWPMSNEFACAGAGTLTHKSVDQGIRSPLRSGEKLADRVHYQLSDIAARPELVRSFFSHPSVAEDSDL